MTREQMLSALQSSYEKDIDNLEDVFVTGLATGERIAALAERYDRGFAIANAGNEKMKADVETYFSNLETKGQSK